MGTNHSLGYSGALRMLQPWDEFPGGGESLFLGMAELCRTQWWLSPTHASDSPALVGQRTLVLSPVLGLTLWELVATTAHLYGGILSPQTQTGAWLQLPGHQVWQL